MKRMTFFARRTVSRGGTYHSATVVVPLLYAVVKWISPDPTCSHHQLTQSSGICSLLVERNFAISLCRDIDNSRLVRILSEKILVVAKVPVLNCRLRDSKKLASIHWCAPWRGDGEGEIGVGVRIPGSLAAVDRRVDFQANVKVLTSKVVDLVRGKDATEGWARSQTLEILRGST